MKPLTQGQAANRSGATAEHVIASVLQRRGLSFERQYAIGLGIYGTPIKADFYMSRAPGLYNGLVIESKWQDSSGSADEKLPYLVANIRECYPCPAIVVADGEGFRPGALVWLRQQVDGSRLLAVYSIAQFISWAQRLPRMAVPPAEEPNG